MLYFALVQPGLLDHCATILCIYFERQVSSTDVSGVNTDEVLKKQPVNQSRVKGHGYETQRKRERKDMN